MTELPKPSSSNIHVSASDGQRRTKGKGKDGFKRVDNSNTRWFRGKGKGKGKHTGSGKSGASAHHANLTSVEDDDCYDEDMNESAKPTMTQLTREVMTLDCDDDEENDTFSPYVALDDVTVFETAELDAIALLPDTWDVDLDPEVSALRTGKRER